jgi:hypothetical protein
VGLDNSKKTYFVLKNALPLPMKSEVKRKIESYEKES